MLNLFIHNDALRALANQDLDLNQIPLCDANIEIVDSPLSGRLRKDGDKLHIRSYTRDEIMSDGHMTAELTLEKGQEIDRDAAPSTIYLSLLAAKLACAYLARHNLLEKGQNLDETDQGMEFSADGDTINVRIVSGKERPKLSCVNLTGDFVMCRPYRNDPSRMSLFAGLFGAESLEFLLEEAEDGDPEAMEKVAMSYLNGENGAEADPEQAVYWFRKLAEAGIPTGQFNLGLHYAKGFGVDRDFKTALRWMQKARENGDPDAADIIEKLSRAVEAEPKAKAGDAQAQADLANTLMFLGNSLDQAGPGKDYAEAFALAEKSAAQNNGDGIWVLALAYEHGRGVKQDTEKAIQLYARGTKLDHAPSQNSYACFILRGEIPNANPKLAFSLLQQSARQGYDLGMLNLGKCYQFGNGVEENMKLAIEWYEKYLEIHDDPELRRKVQIFKTLPMMDEDDAPANPPADFGGMNIYEKISAILSERGEPTGVASLMAALAPMGVSHRDLCGVLLSMCNEGSLHRCIRGGKFYFSLTRMENEVSNPCSSFIGGMQKALNRLGNLGSEENDALAQSMEALQGLNDLAEALANGSVPTLSFSQKRRYRNKQYSIAIPDGFTLRENHDGRDFVAWLPNPENPEDCDIGQVVLYAGNLNPFDDQGFMLPEQIGALVEAMVWRNKQQMDVISKTTVFPIRQGKLQGAIMADCANAHVQLGLRSGVKQMRVFLNDSVPQDKRQVFADMVKNWIATMEPADPFPGLTPMDDPKKYLSQPLNRQLADAFRAGVDEWYQHLCDKLLNYRTQALIQEMQYRQANGGMTEYALRSMIIEMHKNIGSLWEPVIEQAVRTLEHFCRKDPNNKLLLDLHEVVSDILESALVNTIDDHKEVRTTFEIAKKCAPRIDLPAIRALKAKFGAEKKKEQDARKAKAVAESLRGECEQCVSEFLREMRQAESDRDNEINSLYMELNHSSIDNASRARSRFTSCNNSAGRRIERALYKFDQDAQALANRGADHLFMKRVIECIDDCIESLKSMRLEIDVGFTEWVIEYRVSSSAQETRQKWQNMYSQSPEVARERRQKENAEAIRTLEKSIQKANQQKNLLKKQEGALRAQMEASEKEASRLGSGLPAERSQVESRQDARIAEAEKNLQALKAALADQESRLRSTQTELDGMFFLAFGKKKAAREQIESLQSQISRSKGEITRAEENVCQLNKDKQTQLSALDEKLAKAREQAKSDRKAFEALPGKIAWYENFVRDAQQEIEARRQDQPVKKSLAHTTVPDADLPEPGETKSANAPARKSAPAEMGVKDIEELVLQTLAMAGRPVTISECVDLNLELAKIGNQKTASIMRGMMGAGRVVRTEQNRKAYFSLP